MIRWLLENVGLMLLSLIIAVVVWIAQEWDRDRIFEDEFENPIPVEVINLPPGTHLVEGWQQDVRVKLRAPESVWNRLRTEDFEAVLDLSPQLSPLESGVWDVEVKVSLGAEPAVLLEKDPKFIRVELEAIRERAVPIHIEVRGEPALGYQAGDPIVISDTVTIRGPASQVDQVVRVVTSVSLQGLRDDWSGVAPTLTPVDGQGNRVNELTLTPERVQVRVPVEQQSNFKEMTVRPNILGQPAADYYIAEVRLNPSVVLLAGSRAVLDDLPGVLTTVPISIEGRTEDVVERLSLELPPGVATVSPNEPAVQLTIDIEPFLGSTTVTRTVSFQGLQPGLAAIASPEAVELILSGPRPRLSTLLQEDVRVILDLSALGLGDEDQLTPVVVQPEGITVESIIPSVIQVRIVQMPVSTPTPSPQPSE